MGFGPARMSPAPSWTPQPRCTRCTAEDAWQWNERWLLLAGVRHDRAAIDRDELVAGTDFSRTLRGTSWRLGLTHFLTPDTSLYAQLATGYDPVTSLITLNLANADFKLSQGRQMEVGLKQKLAGGLERGWWRLIGSTRTTSSPVTRTTPRCPFRVAASIRKGSSCQQR